MKFRVDLGHRPHSARFTLTWFLTFQDSASERLYERSLSHSLLARLLPLVLALAAWSTAPLVLTSLCILHAVAWWRGWSGADLLALGVAQSSLRFLSTDLSIEVLVVLRCALGKR
jgi:hypothetical protein